MYKTRNGTTNVPNLFRNVPRQTTQTGRGKLRKVAQSDISDSATFINGK
jgi:hypothetical protein